ADNFGEPKEALNYAMSAYRLQPGDPRIMDTLGYVLIKAERPEDAAILLEKAHRLLPEVQTVALHLAMAKARSGQSAAAKDLLQQVIEKGTEAEIVQAQDILKSL
ncbi:MAG: PEP-CTERM system TPR-repeat protein PrsT, partial [Desulfuromonadaceae bacterium]|nr:PEP-CTERM system TPR-repeat protein PrsT [Desulfuromonadaceae bacterium]